MDRTAIINTVGIEFHTPNIEAGEYSYVQAAGSKENLIKALGTYDLNELRGKKY